MNFILHKHQTENHIVSTPDGLRELLDDISREVLRCQPVNIYKFIADYLDAMLITREHATITQHTLNSIISLSMTIADLLQGIGISVEKSKKSASIIEASLKKHIGNTDSGDSLAKNSLVIERDIFLELIEVCQFSKDDVHCVRKIIQSCFKNYYFQEKEFALKVWVCS